MREQIAQRLSKVAGFLGKVRGLFRHGEAADRPSAAKTLDFSGFNGGRDRDRTCDPYHVKVVLFR